MNTTTFQQVIRLWPTAAEFAQDIGVKPATVRQWVARDSIPGGYWLRIVRASDTRQLGVTLEQLARAAAAQIDDQVSAAA